MSRTMRKRDKKVEDVCKGLTIQRLRKHEGERQTRGTMGSKCSGRQCWRE